MATPDTSSAPAIADPSCEWIEWELGSQDDIARMVEEFEPLDRPAGHNAARWLKDKARNDLFTVTHLLVSTERVEGFITCRVSAPRAGDRP